MFDWVRRIVIPSGRPQITVNEDETFLEAAKVKRLVDRFVHEAVAPPPRATPEMPVIVVCSQKGGAGKTTIAAHLAVQAGAAGRGPVVLIDTDPQGSLAAWWRARDEHAPALATVRLSQLAADLAELRRDGAAITIIDTPPALTASIEQVIAVADLVIIPARPSPHDLRAIGATVEMARRAGKRFLFVVNGAAPRANITAQSVAALSEHGRVAPIILYQRTAYAASMINGRTAIEMAPSSRSAQETVSLWEYIWGQFASPEATLVAKDLLASVGVSTSPQAVAPFVTST